MENVHSGAINVDDDDGPALNEKSVNRKAERTCQVKYPQKTPALHGYGHGYQNRGKVAYAFNKIRHHRHRLKVALFLFYATGTNP
jgi:hypothetical protein